MIQRNRQHFLWGIVFTLLATASLSAQDRPVFEVAGGYSRVNRVGLVEGHGSGWLASVSWPVKVWLALVLEGGEEQANQKIGFLGVDTDFQTLLVGTRLSVSAWRVRPFAQVFGGTTRISTWLTTAVPFMSTGQFAERHPTLQVGIGVQAPIGGPFALRAAADYRRIFDVAGLNQIRITTAVAFGFGRR
jgi:hypothetical protein